MFQHVRVTHSTFLIDSYRFYLRVSWYFLILLPTLALSQGVDPPRRRLDKNQETQRDLVEVARQPDAWRVTMGTDQVTEVIPVSSDPQKVSRDILSMKNSEAIHEGSMVVNFDHFWQFLTHRSDEKWWSKWWKVTKTELEDFLVETHVPPRPGPLSVKPRMVKPLLRLRRPGVPDVPAVCCCSSGVFQSIWNPFGTFSNWISLLGNVDNVEVL